MCRNIKTLFNFEPPATDEEIRAASVQFVRKLSGFTAPSAANSAALEGYRLKRVPVETRASLAIWAREVLSYPRARKRSRAARMMRARFSALICA